MKKQSSMPSLYDGVKHLLAVSSLFSEEFSVDWLMELTGIKVTKILFALEEGTSRGWLAKKGPGIFCWVDLKRQKEFIPEEDGRLHRLIADILIKELDHGREKFKAVASHLLHIFNNVESCRWLVKAGDAYVCDFGNEEALQCYLKVLDDLSDLFGEEADSIYIEAAIKYSKISTARHDTKRVLALLQEAKKRAARWSDQTSQALLEMHIAKNEWLASRYRSALEHFERGWAIAKGIDDSSLLRSTMAFSTFFLYWQGRFQEAVQSYERSVPDVEKYPKGRLPLLAAITVGQCYAFTGHVTQALGMLDAIRTQCLERGDLTLASNAEGTIGSIMLEIGRIEEAVQYLESALEKAELKHNYLIQILGKLSLSYAHYLMEKRRKCIAYLREFLDQSRRVKMTVQLYPYLMELSWAMEEKRLQPVSGLAIESEIRRTLKWENIFLKGVAYRYRALLERRKGCHPDKVLHTLRFSLRWLEQSGHQTELARTQLEIARQYMSLGREDKVKTHIRRASDILSPLNEDLLPADLRSLINEPTIPHENLLKEILSLGQEMVSIQETKDLFQHIISTVNQLTGAERGAIFLLEENRTRPVPQLRASKNLTPAQISQKEFSPTRSMIREVAATGKSRILTTAPAGRSGAASDQIIRSCICIPMILRGKVVGVLYHDNRLLGSAFKESDLDLLAYFAALAAIALDNARAYQEINRLNQKLTEEKLYYQEKHLQSLHFEDIIGESPEICRVMAQVNQVASTDTTVLILGETGVGKELIASAIHNSSPRSEKPFIRVNCSALPESLIPSELFGHEKGSFTGATQRRTGRFELADGGTFFLDEIGDLPMDVQIRLLRVLQSKEFERVGGTETLRSDFRLVVATNRNLEELVKGKRIREDLYYRINVFPVYVPPLRDRKEDIPLLAHYFLQIYSKKMGKNFSGIPQKEIDKFMEYHWPGNVRELENIIERGTILSTEPIFQVPSLGMSHTERSQPNGDNTTLKENERRHILWALQKTRWKVRGSGGAAELLDIHPSTLTFRMKKLGIHRPDRFSRRGRPERP